MSKECKGCFDYVDEDDYCDNGIISHLEGTDGCPCRTCLVKSMCTNDACLAYIDYRLLSRRVKSFGEYMDDFKYNKYSSYR